MSYDFEGWATRNDLKCSDGLIIRKDAFKVNNGTKVPLVWNHQHNQVQDVLGHAILENREEGVWAYCSFNDSAEGQGAKQRVLHGDVTALSIWANNLYQVGNDILHGVIREVSLVLAGANPGAFIESVLSHGEPMGEGDDEGIFYTDNEISICHSDQNPEEESKKKEESKSNEKTVQDAIDTMDDDQKAATGLLIEQVKKEIKKELSGGTSTTKKKEEKK